ncbi:hypothetical protein O181_043482 [Austropuccinia psidii MF-1]|uniref:UspA domain-containing protein n=1 Tax=Austropuccinia psidii MF-1 TaxID=1389203 RepID=A0A9Q3DKL6_9BASI|nr:hypothetical protein [Austropuccinia psidii MF-1]
MNSSHRLSLNLNNQPLSTLAEHDDPSAHDASLKPAANHGLRSALKPQSISHVKSLSQLSEAGGDMPSSVQPKTTSLLAPPSNESAPPTSSASAPPTRPSLSRARSTGELLPPGYERRVGFSTMETEEPTKGGGTGAEYSFTLQAKSSNYKPRRDSRCFLVATDGESYSLQALDWLMSSLVEHGDEVVVLQAVDPANKEFILEKEENARSEAQEVLCHALTKNDRQITVIVEFVIGPVIKTIQRMIEVYRPDSLVVGTRGKNPSPWHKAFSLSSTSQYLVARSPVPVIVVRPESKVRQSREARAKDPKRRSYQALIGHQPKPSLSSRNSGIASDDVTIRREQTNPY